MGLIVAAVVGAVLLIVPGSPAQKKAHLGLDLQGGLEVVLKAVPPKSHKITPEDLDRSVSIMRNRIDKLGVAEPELRKQGSDQIVIQLAGVHDPKKAAELIGKTAQLELFDLEADLTGPSISSQGIPTASTSLYDLLATQQAQAKTGTPTGWYVFDDKKSGSSRDGPDARGGDPGARQRDQGCEGAGDAGPDQDQALDRPDQVQALRRPGGGDRDHVRDERGRLARREPVAADSHLLLPDEVQAGRPRRTRSRR